jgi:hypothetical protein
MRAAVGRRVAASSVRTDNVPIGRFQRRSVTGSFLLAPP